MSCRSAIFLENSGTNAVTEGNAIPTGNVVRRFGKNVSQSGSGVVACGDGYFEVIGNFTVVPTAVGVVGVTIVKDGVALGSASQTYAGTAGEPVNLTVVGLIRNACCDGRSFVEFVLSNGTGTVSQSNVIVAKI